MLLTGSRVLLNAAAFQLAWLGIILGGLGVGAVFTVAVCALYLAMAVKDTPSRPVWHSVCRESLWLLAVLLVGWLVEFVFVAAGILVFDSAVTLAGVPAWLLLLWLAFATTFRFSFAFLVRFWVLAFPVGALACLSYWAGVTLRIDAAFGWAMGWSLTGIAVVWAWVMGGLCWAYQRWWLH